MGDDKTDESMFKAAPAHAVTVKVGARGETCARFFVQDPAEARAFLRLVAFGGAEEAPPVAESELRKHDDPAGK